MKIPAVFIGHGSPMLALDENHRSVKAWKQLAREIPKPKAILVISAHWYVAETSVTAQTHPKTIHDFGNFPQELFDVEYPAPGSPELAERVAQLVAEVNKGNRPRLDRDSWGFDHGTWCVLKHMYPNADIPVVQLSLDCRKPMEYHYSVGRQLAQLRDEGVLILGSGNLVHNFAYLSEDETPKWATDFVDWIKSTSLDKSIDRDDAKNYPVVHWEKHAFGPQSQMGPDHFVPSLYILGAAGTEEEIEWSGETWEMSTLSMACFKVGA